MNNRIDIQTCREHHTSIRFLIEELEKCDGDEKKLLGFLVRLKNLLVAHLRLEDDWLYPKLLKSENVEIAAKAQVYSQEMGGIKNEFLAVYETWSKPGAISADQARFSKEWEQFSARLESRMSREDEDLYVVALQVAASANK
ncbi:MAG: hypothetical protein NVSMB31_04330 [Vulcanimicrobiaceae bacterium]